MRSVKFWGLAGVVSLLTACTASVEPVETAAPTLVVTNWTERTELFAEYPPLVEDEHAVFAVHLTDLRDFSALTSGTARVELTPEAGGPPAVLEGGASRPGVFRSEGTVPAAGRYAMALLVDAPGLTDRHELGTATVFSDQETAYADAEAHAVDDAAAITYLKEQQWVNPFATEPAREADLRRALRFPAQIGPVTGGEAIVGAPAAGRFTAETLLSIGAVVARDQVMGRLEPRLAGNGADRATLASGVAEAEVAVEAARVELTRAEGLLEERAVPARRVDEARRTLAVAESRLQAAQARLTQRDETLRSGGGTAAGNAFVLRAPIAGRVAEVSAALGASYDEGALLFRIVRTDEVELQAMVPAADVPQVRRVESLALEVPGRPEPIALAFDHMHDSGVIDARTRALPVQFDVDNRDGRLLIGQTGTVLLYVGDRERMLAVPAAALLTEAGRPHVFVQTGGESFARRFIEIGVRDGDLVGVRSGLRPGERVVTRGAYDIQLAAASNALPAEGHVH
jgi:RND family efflux transporter MFP subunit